MRFYFRVILFYFIFLLRIFEKKIARVDFRDGRATGSATVATTSSQSTSPLQNELRVAAAGEKELRIIGEPADV